MNALELQGLTKHYKDFTLGPLDLTLPGGTICGLIGENGAGKSTTIRLILDMVQRDGGTVTILGRDSRTASVRAKEEIGVVLGSEGIPLCLNAVQAGKVMAGIYQNWDAAAYAELCQKFGLPDKKQYKDYSTGMKMKLCIAVALAHHPKLLLLDEATNGLAASRAKRKTLARARIAAADLLREEMMLPAMWQYPSRLPTEERRRTRKKNTISFPSWNGAAARAESRSPWKNR